MQQETAILKIKPLEALIVMVVLLTGISYFMIFLGVVPHIPITLAVIGLIAYGLVKKVSIKNLEAGMVDGAKSGLGAIFIFFFIGMLISSWIASGTIPTFIYVALNTVGGEYFYAIVFIVTSIIGLCIGSSLTTAATLGVTFISVGSALDLSVAITAGAVISGAFFGDKMSPLSDTTNLAAMVAGVDLFEHIKNMLWTTVPAFILSFVFFMMLSPDEEPTHFDKISELKRALIDLDYVHWYSVIPFIILAVLALKKVSSIVTLAVSTISALLLSPFVQSHISATEIFNLLYYGYKSESGIAEIDSLLTRGGMESMMFSIALVLLALSMGGLLFKLGIIPALLDGIKKFLGKTAMLISSTAFTAIGVNFLLGEQYLSILLTGNTLRNPIKKQNSIQRTYHVFWRILVR